jgi:IS5 family transposase
VDEDILIYGDPGYSGIHEYHGNSIIPIKAGRNNLLSEKEKAYNKRLSRKRIAVEHIDAKIKTFKIMAYPYKNHCKRHLLRLSLICGIINFENRCK